MSRLYESTYAAAVAINAKRVVFPLLIFLFLSRHKGEKSNQNVRIDSITEIENDEVTCNS